MGYAYEIGKNYEKAIFFYEKSQASHAHVRLGKMHLSGKGKPKSEPLAIEHFQKAAYQENVDGHYYLGLMNLKDKVLTRQSLRVHLNILLLLPRKDTLRLFSVLGS